MMSVNGFNESFLKLYETYVRSPVDEMQSLLNEPGDIRERVRRDTIRGKYGIFHQNLEQYLYRHWRAFTIPRMSVFAFCSYSLLLHSIYQSLPHPV